MSLSNPQTEAQPNPASPFYEWKGSEGCFVHYDKVNKENVKTPLPFSFIPLDVLVTVKGWNEKEQKGYWSNEVRNLLTDVIYVRSKSGLEFAGLYKDIKPKLEAKGISYVQSVYVGMKDSKGKLTLSNIQIKGSALKPWIELSSKSKVLGAAISVNSTTDQKTGAVKYKAPVFTLVKLKEATLKEATELDKTLQEYLNGYFERNKTASTEQVVSQPKVVSQAAEAAFDDSKHPDAQYSKFSETVPNDIITNLDMPDEF